MAVAPMTKAHVCIHGTVREEVIQRIYDIGVLQAIEIYEQPSEEHEPSLRRLDAESAPKLAEFDSQLREVNHALEILSEYDETGRELIENFVALKHPIARETMMSIREEFEFSEIASQLAEHAESLKHLEEEEKWLQDDVELLNLLQPVPFPLFELHVTTRVKTLIGQIRKENLEAFEQKLSEYEEWVFWEHITTHGQFEYLFLMYYDAPLPAREGGTSASKHEILERYGFDTLDLSRYALTVPEELQRVNEKLEQVRKKEEDLKIKLKGFTQYTEHFKVIEEYLSNEIERYKDLQNFARTESVYFVEGWMKQIEKHALERGLHGFNDSIEILYTDADQNDPTVPVILENPPHFQPFEIVTRMFGMPKYTEPDPTPILAPFFALFFGLCLTDAGYGILLAVIMWWLMRKYLFDAGTKQLARLLLYGGIATIFCGALTGGWFGDMADHLPSVFTAAKNSLMIIDPLKEPIRFLGFALFVGYVQVCYGIYLKMRHRIRQGDKENALIDEGIWLLFINSLLLWGITSIFISSSLLGKMISSLFALLAIASGGARIWLNDRENPNVVMRILAGLYSLYDIVGIFSDVLSYSRLLALGLATGVIATVINLLAQMTLESVPRLGFIVAIIIFCCGHVFNLVINALGAFIHSGRLQFVEFFSKFFEAGGKKYKPFKFQSQYFEISD